MVMFCEHHSSRFTEITNCGEIAAKDRDPQHLRYCFQFHGKGAQSHKSKSSARSLAFHGHRVVMWDDSRQDTEYAEVCQLTLRALSPALR